MANGFDAPRVLREQTISKENSIVHSINYWYSPAGDRITSIFIDGVLAGPIAINDTETIFKNHELRTHKKDSAALFVKAANAP